MHESNGPFVPLVRQTPNLGSGMIQRLRINEGDTIFLPDCDGQEQMLVVKARKRTGYLLLHSASKEQRVWSDQEIFDHYIKGKFRHFAADIENLSTGIRETLDADFDAWGARKCFAARQREEYCMEVDRMLAQGDRPAEAYAKAATSVFEKNSAQWEKQQAVVYSAQEIEACVRKIKATAITQQDKSTTFKQPSQYAVRNWHGRWSKGGRDVRALAPHFHLRGDRSGRYPNNMHLASTSGEPKCVYSAMRWVTETIYFSDLRVTFTFAYSQLKKLLALHSLPIVTMKTFRRFTLKHYNDFEEYRGLHGARKAYYKFHIFERRALPKMLLEEVEIDHTLIDAVVVDKRGFRHRPWLTLITDRASRAIIGFHIGFDWPSYATVQRALIPSPIECDSLRGFPRC